MSCSLFQRFLVGMPNRRGAIDAINLALSDCSLKNRGFVGSPFTWANGHT